MASNETRVALWVLLAAVVLLQLIACVNVANLLLARGIARHREIAVRSALGASRGRLIRFVMMESLLISFCGTVSGLLGAFFALPAIQQLDLKVIPRLAEAQLNLWVLSFAVVSAVATGSIGRIGSGASRSHDSNCFDIARRRKTDSKPRSESPARHTSHG